MAVLGVLRFPKATATSGTLVSETLNSILRSLVPVQTENAKDRSHLPGRCPAPPAWPVPLARTPGCHLEPSSLHRGPSHAL